MGSEVLRAGSAATLSQVSIVARTGVLVGASSGDASVNREFGTETVWPGVNPVQQEAGLTLVIS